MNSEHTSGGPATLSVTGLFKAFETPGGRLEVLRGVDFSLEPGRSLSVVGPSGSGKSTLLNILAALTTADDGAAALGECDICRLPAARRPGFRAANIGMVFQDHLLIEHLSAMDNILLGAMAAGRVGGEQIGRARGLAESLGIADRLDHRPGALSGGQKQRVAIARALINAPGVILADEPTGQLDEATSSEVVDLLLGCARDSGAMLIMVTHDRPLAGRLDAMRLLDDGVLIETDAAGSA